MKLDVRESKELYSKIPKVELNECYVNTFKSIEFLDKMDSYLVCYGYLLKPVHNTLMGFRHCYLKNKNTQEVVDVTACLWEELDTYSDKFEYYSFKEIEVNDYIDILLEEDGKCGLHSLYIDKEMNLIERIVLRDNYTINPIDLINVLTEFTNSKSNINKESIVDYLNRLI